MEFQNRTLTCVECGREFVFTAGEQKFYHEKGFENDPKRCPECRAARKRRGKKFTTVVCAECGRETEVPFKPVEGRPVYCRECYERKFTRI